MGPGRGSGAGLSSILFRYYRSDPLEYDLIFERFLNPDRTHTDFDIDFNEEKRDQVFEYLKTKYKDGVAHIIAKVNLKLEWH